MAHPNKNWRLKLRVQMLLCLFGINTKQVSPPKWPRCEGIFIWSSKRRQRQGEPINLWQGIGHRGPFTDKDYNGGWPRTLSLGTTTAVISCSNSRCPGFFQCSNCRLLYSSSCHFPCSNRPVSNRQLKHWKTSIGILANGNWNTGKKWRETWKRKLKH